MGCCMRRGGGGRGNRGVVGRHGRIRRNGPKGDPGSRLRGPEKCRGAGAPEDLGWESWGNRGSPHMEGLGGAWQGHTAPQGGTGWLTSRHRSRHRWWTDGSSNLWEKGPNPLIPAGFFSTHSPSTFRVPLQCPCFLSRFSLEGCCWGSEGTPRFYLSGLREPVEALKPAAASGPVQASAAAATGTKCHPLAAEESGRKLGVEQEWGPVLEWLWGKPRRERSGREGR